MINSPKERAKFISSQQSIARRNQVVLLVLLALAIDFFRMGWYYCGIVLTFLTIVFGWRVVAEYIVLRQYRRLGRLVLLVGESKTHQARIELALINAPELSGKVFVDSSRPLGVLVGLCYRLAALLAMIYVTVGILGIATSYLTGSSPALFWRPIQMAADPLSVTLPIIFYWTIGYTRYIHRRLPLFKRQCQLLQSELTEGGA